MKDEGVENDNKQSLKDPFAEAPFAIQSRNDFEYIPEGIGYWGVNTS